MPQARVRAKNYKMEDVARAANVSISTVSRAFSQPDRVDPETRESIFA
ncbi:MAG: LacI family DNA-binding transcriptional regulator, partial [Proteobacteria bacterium]|nr:LacI family DNA-binding transcriptional regulator [Pseudomonadota bacterium]